MLSTGFEPVACCLGGSRSILLSYESNFIRILFFNASIVNFFTNRNAAAIRFRNRLIFRVRAGNRVR